MTETETETTQLISQRQAAGLLADVGLSRRHARRVLASGLAGRPVVTSAATLFDRSLVDELARRPLIHVDQVDAVCPRGLFIARRDVDVRLSWAEQCAALDSGWGLSWLGAGMLGLRVDRDGRARGSERWSGGGWSRDPAGTGSSEAGRCRPWRRPPFPMVCPRFL